MAVEFPVKELCALLEVSRSGYYAWGRRKPCRRQLQNEQLLQRIKEVHRQSRQSYGSPRVTRQLRKDGSLTANLSSPFLSTRQTRDDSSTQSGSKVVWRLGNGAVPSVVPSVPHSSRRPSSETAPKTR